MGKDKVDIERLMVRVISRIRMRIDEIENVPGALLATVTLQDQLVAKQQVSPGFILKHFSLLSSVKQCICVTLYLSHPF